MGKPAISKTNQMKKIKHRNKRQLVKQLSRQLEERKEIDSNVQVNYSLTDQTTFLYKFNRLINKIKLLFR